MIDRRFDPAGEAQANANYGGVSRAEWQAAKPEERFVLPVKENGGYSRVVVVPQVKFRGEPLVFEEHPGPSRVSFLSRLRGWWRLTR